MSNTNRVNLAYIKEVVFGVTPGGPPTLSDVRFNTEGLVVDTNFVTSQEIRSDRQISDATRVGVSTTGPVAVELSYGSHDEWRRAALQHDDTTWTPAITLVATDISATAIDNSINSAAAGFTHTAGQWISIAGFTGVTSNNGVARIETATSSKLTLSGITLVDDAAGESVTIKQGEYIKNGTTQDSYSIEKAFLDVASTFEQFVGQVLDSWGMAFGANNIVTENFNFIGKNGADGTSTVGDDSNTAVNTNAVLNSVDHLTAFLENQVEIDVTEYSHTLVNNSRARMVAGTLGSTSVGAGSVGVTGNFSVYLENQDLTGKYKAGTISQVALVFTDGAGNIIIVDFPNLKYSAAPRVTPGLNQDVMVRCEFTAYRDPTFGFTVQVCRLPAA